MKKRVIISVIGLLLGTMGLFLFSSSTLAYPETEDEFYEYVENLNYDLDITLSDGTTATANWSTYQTYDLLVWGSPHGDDSNDSLCGNPSEYRYLGYNSDGQAMTNSCFRDDEDSGRHPKEWDFVNVNRAGDSWQGPRSHVLSHIQDSDWTGTRAPSNDPLRYSHIGSDSKVRIDSTPSWKSSGSVYVQHRGRDGNIYYATFTVPPMVGSHILSGRMTTDRSTYTIGAEDNSVTVSYEVQAEANIDGYAQYSDVTELTAQYQSKLNTTSQQRYSTLSDTLDLTRNNYGPGTHEITLEGTVSINTQFGDDESRKVFKKIDLVVEEPTHPNMTTTATSDPSTKNFSSDETVSDVSVQVTVNGQISGLSDTSRIKRYELIARTEEGNSQLQTQTYTGSQAQQLAQSHSFGFTVDKTLFENSSFTQNFVTRARATLYDGTVITSLGYAQTKIYPPNRTPEPDPVMEDPEDDLDPPVVSISGNSSVQAGNSIHFSSSSHAPSGTIVDQSWSTPSSRGSINGSSGSIVYMASGRYTVRTTVTDDNGLTGTASHSVRVTPPYPRARFEVGGSLKENRKVTLSENSTTPTHYPIDYSNSYWEITAKEEENNHYIRYQGVASGSSMSKTLNTLFKAPGEYKIKLYIENTSGLSDTLERTITIIEDEPPVADFTTTTKVYRDRNNNQKATLRAIDKSYSDDDYIQQRIWSYRFDSRNDGRFDNEERVIIDDANKLSISFEVDHVGDYLIELEVVEGFGQPTIEEFINDDDYLRNRTY